MKRLLLVLSFLFLFLFPSSDFVLAQTPTSIPSLTPTPIPVDTSTQPTQNLWTQFWTWLFGLFTKTDYTISVRSSTEINSDMTDYGDLSQADEFKNKHSFAGSRVTDSQSQTCLKGSVIKKVILNTAGYPNSDLSYICVGLDGCAVSSDTTCKLITIKDLAHYFVQIQKQFYCASDKNELVDIDQDVISKVNQSFSTEIPQNQISCYQQIYEDFYLTPKDTTDNEEENTKKMIKTPISSQNQDDNSSNKDLKQQLNQNFSPDGTSAGLSGLRPEAWK